MIFDRTSPLALAATIANRPLAMSSEGAAAAFEILSTLQFSALGTFGAAHDARATKSYEISAGIATIRLHNQAVNRSTRLTDFLGFAAYDRLRASLAAAAADRDVRGVILDLDSPGGDVAGATETAAAVRAFAKQKPIVAYVDSLAASAAYVIAAATNHIIVTPSATLGSIGVVYLHLDHSQAMADRGVKPTILHAGAFKKDGNRFEPLGDARKRIQATVHAAHELILSSVGSHRPGLGVSGARKTEAGVYMGQRAVSAGLADAVGTMETARAYFTPASPPTASPVASIAQTSTAFAGVKLMSGDAPASSPPGPPLRPLPPGHFYSQEALKRVVSKSQRSRDANALVARQLRGQSVDDAWSEAVGAAAGANPQCVRPQPTEPTAAQLADDSWSEILAKSNLTARREVLR